MRVSRKKMLTLLEVLISLGLTVILLGVLSLFYRQLSRFDKAQESLRKNEILLRVADRRLKDTLGKSLNSTQIKTDFLFFTGSGGEGLFLPGSPYLLFIYDRGVDRDAQFSNEVIGKLYIDTQKRLTLTTWPIYSRWEPRQPPAMKKEILLEGVSALKFYFYFPEKKSQLQKPPTEVPRVIRGVVIEEAKTSEEWRNEWGRLPAIVFLNVAMDNDTKQEEKFVIPLVNFDKWITYSP